MLNIASRYTSILGQKWSGVPSTYHQVFRYLGPNGIMELHGDQNAAQECHEMIEAAPRTIETNSKIMAIEPNNKVDSPNKNPDPTTSRKGKEVALSK